MPCSFILCCRLFVSSSVPCLQNKQKQCCFVTEIFAMTHEVIEVLFSFHYSQWFPQAASYCSFHFPTQWFTFSSYFLADLVSTSWQELLCFWCFLFFWYVGFCHTCSWQGWNSFDSCHVCLLNTLKSYTGKLWNIAQYVNVLVRLDIANIIFVLL